MNDHTIKPQTIKPTVMGEICSLIGTDRYSEMSGHPYGK